MYTYNGNALLIDLDGNGTADLAIVSQTGAISTSDILFH